MSCPTIATSRVSRVSGIDCRASRWQAPVRRSLLPSISRAVDDDVCWIVSGTAAFTAFQDEMEARGVLVTK